MDGRIVIGGGAAGDASLSLAMANRHGLIAGATGTGKTVTLQVLAEGFSAAGVPVFLADVKGDLSGISRPGTANPKLDARAAQLGITRRMMACPTVFWDLFGAQGHPIRATVSDMGPVLLARLLDLNDTQEGVLNLTFKLADDDGLLLLDLKDLQALLASVSERASDLAARYGNVAKPTVGAIQRQLLTLDSQGGDAFFGEPALAIADLMRPSLDGRGIVHVLAADRLINQSPKLYATFLLWLLAELFEELPEAGDLDRPKLVFVFDEAHLLFADAPPALVEQVERVVRLIRSKGVGVYFVTQNPLDLPESVLGQLGNRVQHALRAFTPRDQKAVRAAAETFRPNPKLDIATVITELGVGEALVSTLDDKGAPRPVERVFIRPPESRLGPVTAEERAQTLAASPLAGRYDQAIDRDSAYEMLTRRAQQTSAEHASNPSPTRREPPSQVAEIGGTLAKSVIRSVGSAIGSRIGREIVRGVLGALLKGR